MRNKFVLAQRLLRGLPREGEILQEIPRGLSWAIVLLLATFVASSTLAATTKTIYCPKPAALKKNLIKLTWSANRNTFRSYDISFSKKIDTFTGAQWVGANVGQITCVYKTHTKTAFPVLLIFHTLTLEPKGGAWSRNLGGYRNCNSLNYKQCSFKVRLKKKQTDIYQEAEKLKNSTTSEPPSE